MPLNPDEKPKEFLIIILAVGLKVFGNKPWSDEQHFEAAEKFIAEAEKRYGKLNP
jgi:hypothetical protein